MDTNIYYKEKKTEEIIRAEIVNDNGIYYRDKTSNQLEWISNTRLELFYTQIDIYEEKTNDILQTGYLEILKKLKNAGEHEWESILKNPGKNLKEVIIELLKNSELISNDLSFFKMPKDEDIEKIVSVLIENHRFIGDTYHIKNNNNKTLCGKTFLDNVGIIKTNEGDPGICKKCLKMQGRE